MPNRRPSHQWKPGCGCYWFSRDSHDPMPRYRSTTVREGSSGVLISTTRKVGWDSNMTEARIEARWLRTIAARIAWWKRGFVCCASRRATYSTHPIRSSRWCAHTRVCTQRSSYRVKARKCAHFPRLSRLLGDRDVDRRPHRRQAMQHLVHRVRQEVLRKLVWCRVTVGEGRKCDLLQHRLEARSPLARAQSRCGGTVVDHVSDTASVHV